MRRSTRVALTENAGCKMADGLAGMRRKDGEKELYAADLSDVSTEAQCWS